MTADLGHALQVVDVKDDHTFELDEGALEQALLIQEVADLPVVVVSVAGAYRGGKSFLLDFFLRYLNAPEAKREDGTWLGRKDEPLVGFHWRTGASRNTIGIHIWSRPFVMTTPTGEKVAVLLMDTQGTFDNESTMRECTTIFAISTLLSSVQIYNLTGNLKEDDLQHLQLFTEYAKLVISETGKPFQHLNFLIRDWMYTSDFDYGTQGGQQLLNAKLQVSGHQPAELQEIRQHIHSCFEDISCFLMAHPGFEVSKKDFQGRLEDIRPEFKACLLELVPSVFASHRLVRKRIGGEPVTARQLLLYLRTYLDVFNHGDLPTPTTILQATASASLLLATEAAQAQYAAGMAAACAGAALPAAALYRRHVALVADARTHLLQKKTMADRQMIDEAVTQLLQNLDSRIQHYTATNEGKIKRAQEEALHHYVDQMLRGGDEVLLCRSPKDLEDAHHSAKTAALKLFSLKFSNEEGCEDKETPILLKDINEHYRKMVQQSDINSNLALSAALDAYAQAMDRATNGGAPCMSLSQLIAVHCTACADAETLFRSKRASSGEDEPDDKLISQFKKELGAQYQKYQQLNKINNENACAMVVACYKHRLSELLRAKCLAACELDSEESYIREEAMFMYHNKRTIRTQNDTTDNIYLAEIRMQMHQYHVEMKKNNEQMNKDAMASAYSEYEREMDTCIAKFSWLTFMVITLPARLIQLGASLNAYDSHSQGIAIERFKQHRRNGRVFNTGDCYYDELQTELKKLYHKYNDTLKTWARQG